MPKGHHRLTLLLIATCGLLPGRWAHAEESDPSRFHPLDVFELEWASDPQLSPDGSRVAYVRNFMDVMTDRRRSNIWMIGFDGDDHRPVTTGMANDRTPRWSPDGQRLLYSSRVNGSSQLFVRWIDSGQTAQITHLTRDPSDISWSPDGQWIAFSMRVPSRPEPFAEMPAKPTGAEWANPPRVVETLIYRIDGAGFLEEGFQHLFVVPAEGGSPRQITAGDFNHGDRAEWSPDGRSLIFAANRHPGWELEPRDSEIYEVALDDSEIRVLTDRRGPDESPRLSPDGSRVAYLGFDDRLQGYQNTWLYVMSRDGNGSRLLSGGLDRSVRNPEWSADGKGIFVQYDNEGNTKLAYLGLDGQLQDLAGDLGGLSLGRPYSGAQYSTAAGRYVFTQSRPHYPSDLAVGSSSVPGGHRITHLNDDLLGHKELATIEEIWFESSHDGRRIQGWIAKPPGFDPGHKYPLLLEIHGGPFANYGDRFSSEIQLYATAGYVVVYINPRGSTSYGEEFGNLIHHNYPGEDFDDLMSGVDAVLALGYVDENRLYVTGGSGGGVLTAWIVGHTDRFRAAVAAKPVINWYSFALTADFYNMFYKYWFPGFPWEYPEEYLERSPLHHVGKVSTPTMLLTGEVDYRTPMSESEQFYQALKLRQIDTALVRIPDAAHGIADRPSQLIAKVNYILAWFARYGGTGDSTSP